MGILGFEYTMSHMTVERAMKICFHADEVLPELLPQFFSSVERLEGVGEVGSTRVVTLGPGMYNLDRANTYIQQCTFLSSHAPSNATEYIMALTRILLASALLPYHKIINFVEELHMSRSGNSTNCTQSRICF